MDMKRINLEYLKTRFPLGPENDLNRKKEFVDSNVSNDETFSPSLISDDKEEKRKTRGSGLNM